VVTAVDGEFAVTVESGTGDAGTRLNGHSRPQP
jgi:hypothetical protein